MLSIPTQARERLPQPRLFIGGAFVPSSADVVFEHVYPGSGETTAVLPAAGDEDVDRAVAAARKALPAWSSAPANERRAMLLRVAALLRENAEELSQLTMIDNGAPLAVAQAAPYGAADSFEYFAGWADKLAGSVVPVWPGEALDYTRVEPYGVVGFIIPFNGPIMSIGLRLAPALAVGNTVVLKPSELAPHSALRFASLCTAAGIPDGVVNVVTGGAETGQALVRHPGVDKIHFTGSVTTAERVLATAAAGIKPVGLELGGKSANIVFADADLEAAAEMAVSAALVTMSGQTCICPSRLLVQDSIHDAFLSSVVERAKATRVGDPFDPGSSMGPVISRAACERILGEVQRAVDTGAGHLLCGGERLEGDLAGGFFLQPTVFGDVDHGSPLAQSEIFGPVLAVARFADDDEAIELANGTPYALAGCIHSRDVRRVHRLAAALDAAYVSVNGWCPMPPGAPFGGNGQSGFGRLGGRSALREFTQEKNVYIAL